MCISYKYCTCSRWVDDAVPQLDNGVIVGIGAIVLGGFMAENVAIGVGAVVNKSITEKNIAVAGVLAKKVSNNGRTRWNVKKNQEST